MTIGLSRFLQACCSLALLLAFSLWLAGCKSCQENAQNASQGETTDPWQETVDLLASYVPESASSTIFIVDFTAALATYPGFRARVSTYVRDYATIEADLRNTLGVDLAHPSRLADIGVDPRGGAACFREQGQSLCGTILSDPTAFVSHVTNVVQGQPFNLRAPVVSTTLSNGGTLIRFAAKEGADTALALVHNDKMGFIILRPNHDALETLAAQLAEPREHPLSTHGAFQQLTAHGEHASTFWWLSPAALNDLSKEVSALSDIRQKAFQKPVMQGAVVGLKLHSDAIDGWFSLLLDPENAKIKSLLQRKPGEAAADFSTLVHEDAYTLIRMHANPQEMSHIIQRAIAPEKLEGTSDKLEDVLGQEALEQRLQRALGYDFLVQTTRARLLTLAALMRGGNITAEALGDGLGLIVAFQLKDPDEMRAIFNDITEARPGTLTHVANDDEIPYWTIPNGPAKNIIIYVHDKMLVVSTQKQREDVEARVRATDAVPLSAHSIQEVESFRGPTDDLGIFVDLHAVANNALGKIAGASLPDSLRDAIQVFDEFWARGALHDDTWFDGTYKLRLTTPER